MATARLLLFKGGVGAGPRIERSEPKEGVVLRSTGNAGCKQYVGDALCFMVKTRTRHKTIETVLNNGWRLVAVGGGWRLVVLGGCP